jgi:DnaK suppressor protein
VTTVSSNLLPFAKRLKELQQEVQVTVALAKSAAQRLKLDQSKVGRLSRIDAMQGQAMAQANIQRQLALLLNIEKALKKINTGSYGLCLECDEVIASARLIATRSPKPALFAQANWSCDST